MDNTCFFSCIRWNEWWCRDSICDGILWVWYVRKFPLLYYKVCCWCQWLTEMAFFLPGKKARTFDLEAIFEQTRRTAIERSQHVLGRLAFSPLICSPAKRSVGPEQYRCFLRGATESPWAGRGRWNLHSCPVLGAPSEKTPCSAVLQVIWLLLLK